MRVFFLHYGPSAAIPPLLNCSEILAARGDEVRFLMVQGRDTAAFGRPSGDRIHVTELRLSRTTLGRRWLMLVFSLRAAWITLRWRPDWIYVVDSLSCPAAALLRLFSGPRMLYHEFDLPETPRTGMLPRMLLYARGFIARKADICIAANSQRAMQMSRETGRQNVRAVLNCPPRRAAATSRNMPSAQMRLYYHGTINRERVPEALIVALAGLPERVTLTLAGYETIGSRGHQDRLRKLAAEKRIAGRVRFLGALPVSDMARLPHEHDVGIALMPRTTDNPNYRTMVGASIKVFDYLAAGLALLVSDIPDWTRTYVEPGYALKCDPGNAESIRRSIEQFLDGTSNPVTMGEFGRKRILLDWNFEFQFAPILQEMLDYPAPSAR